MLKIMEVSADHPRSNLIASSGMKQRQSLDLDAKIQMTKMRIKQWDDYWDGEIHLTYSGGKDSGVLRHIIQSMGLKVPSVFSNTGLEYPEIVAHVKEQQRSDNSIVIIRPKMTFRECVLVYGFPLVSKKVAEMVRRMREMIPSEKNAKTRKLYTTGVRSDGEYNAASRIPIKWMKLITAPFNTTEKCCDALKKEPFRRYQKEFGTVPITAIMAAEGGHRATLTTCNSFDGKDPMSRPMLFWTEEDVWEYTHRFNVPYASCYDDYVLEDGAIIPGEKRTGCMFCAFGAHLEKGQNRFQRMFYTHPKQWNYCINKLGMSEAFDFIGLKYRPDKREI